MRSLATILGYIYAVIGFIAGAILSIVALTGSGLSESSDALASLGGPFAIFLLPLVGSVKGYLVGAISAWVFNYAARVSGGLEIELNA